MKSNCRWVKVPGSSWQEAVYCESPVKYRVVRDDDDNRVRRYEAFCPDHMLKAAMLEDEQ